MIECICHSKKHDGFEWPGNFIVTPHVGDGVEGVKKDTNERITLTIESITHCEREVAMVGPDGKPWVSKVPYVYVTLS
jgi:hypothetical protein